MNDIETVPLRLGVARNLCVSLSVLSLAVLASGCKSTPAPIPQDDASLTQAVQAKIAADSSLTSERIQWSVQQGVVTLNGTTSNDAARLLAASDAAQIPGIKTVVNDLVVSQPAVPAPAQTATVAPPAPPKAERAPKHIKPPAVMTEHPAEAPAAPAPVQDAAASPAPIERPAPPPPPAPAPPVQAHSITLSADTTLPIRLSQTLDSATTREGDSFSGVLASDVLVDGMIVLHQGTPVTGRVDTVHEAAHFKGSSLLVIQLTSLETRGTQLAISTDAFSKAGNGRGKNSAEKIGGGAAVGAILGGIFGGGKGAAIGAAAGGGAGAGAQAITRGQQVQIPAESLVRFRLTTPVTLRVSGGSEPASPADLQHHGS